MRLHGNRRRQWGGYIILLTTMVLAFLTRKRPRFSSTTLKDAQSSMPSTALAVTSLPDDRHSSPDHVEQQSSNAGVSTAPQEQGSSAVAKRRLLVEKRGSAYVYDAPREQAAPVYTAPRLSNQPSRGRRLGWLWLLLLAPLLCGLLFFAPRLWQVATNGTSGTASAAVLQVNGQQIDGNSVTVSQVRVPQDAWVALYRADTDGQPDFDALVGQTQVPAGESTQVQVPLAQPVAAGDQLVAVLHTDAGTPGAFEPGGADVPLTRNDAPVAAVFAVEGETALATGGDGASPTPTDNGAAAALAPTPTATVSTADQVTTTATEATATTGTTGEATLTVEPTAQLDRTPTATIHTAAETSPAPAITGEATTEAPGERTAVAGEQTPTAEVDRSPPSEATTIPTAVQASADDARIVVTQGVADSTLLLDTVVAPQAGWVAVYRRGVDGEPDFAEPLGSEPMQQGENRDVEVALTGDISDDEDLVAVLHVDDGEVGTFEYPNGPDVPVAVDGDLITADLMGNEELSSITAEPGAAQTDTEEATAVATEAVNPTATVRPTATIAPTTTVDPTATIELTATPEPTATAEATPTADPTPEVDPTVTSEPATAPDATGEAAGEVDRGAGQASIRTNTTEILTNTVTLDEVTIDRAGWVVLYRTDADGNPDEDRIVGYAPVQRGANSNVEVDLRAALADGERVVALLHRDEGVAGTFEYPGGPDTPLETTYNRLILTARADLPGRLPNTGLARSRWSLLLTALALAILGAVLRRRFA